METAFLAIVIVTHTQIVHGRRLEGIAACAAIDRTGTLQYNISQ